MARELKLREWDEDRGSLSYGRREDFDDMVGFRFDHSESGERVLEQYTGLVDVNGTEIYEGDIVRMHVIILSPDDKIGVVKYSPQYGYSIHFTSGRMARQEYWATGDKHTIEIIGNIHENAELLEED
ncbi:YopX family protein [Weissella confusa]|uniref:YopX family protein n=1 Tax=Weissella confusa TaxID=1583 RepID=UPI002A7507AD|nr:YopX family protein [Weissella confusa]MDY2511617.1 YopX family protein [Weissella confusa]